jgi:probable H4MPT-linked C1 transfer pathway protein
MPVVLGLDIGGANLKAALSNGKVRTLRFELWRAPGELADALRKLIGLFPSFDLLAVTMTGELCDCYANKREGVTAILEAVATAAEGKPLRVWRSDARLASTDEAHATPLQVASANWLALATFAGRFARSGSSLVIDIGSTTTDLVPLEQGHPTPRGLTDPERLRSHELVYTGVRRTPVCALLNGFGAAEWFATTLDVNLLLGLLPENDHDCGTADGRPATRSAALARLARMLCGDDETCLAEEVVDLAQRVLGQQETLLVYALGEVARCLAGPPEVVVLSGSGEFLARRVLARQQSFPQPRVLSLRETLGAEVSQAACAYAIAILAAEQIDGLR